MKKKDTTVTATVGTITQDTAPTAINIASLSPEQLAKLQSQLKAMKKANSADRTQWNAIVDRMLHETDGEGFKWTTADILAELMARGVVRVVTSAPDRAAEIKKIQTRKQLLEKKTDDKGAKVHKVGYKPSTNSFGPLTIERIVEWMQVAGNVELITVKHADAIHKAIKHII